jgi:hypothetical protein
MKRQLSLLLLLPLFGHAQITNIWALGDGEKVFRYDSANPAKNGNLIWDGKTIHLKGLYNEVLAFQVIVQTGAEGAKGIEIVVSAPVQQSSGKTIGATTQKYGPTGTIEIFSEHYLTVKDSTAPNWYYGSAAAAPKKMTGSIPDALIPANAMIGRGGFPFDIPTIKQSSKVSARNSPSTQPTAQNQGFWIDLSLPRDMNANPPGTYTSSVQIWAGGKNIKEIPLEVTLLPHYLPDENASTVWVFSGDMEAYFPELTPKQIDEMIKFEGHRHRIDLTGGFPVNDAPFDAKTMNAYKPYLTGEAYTPENGYHGTGQGIGEHLFPIGAYGADVMGHTRTEVQQQANDWVNWFKKNSPHTNFFWYLIDEPSPDKYDWIEERAQWIRTDTGAGKSMPVFTTRAYEPALANAINIFAGYDGVDLTVLPELRKKGIDHWFYNGNRPRYGSVILEGAAVDLRVTPWILYKYGINTWYVWQSTHWQHNQQGPKHHLHQNVFENPLTFINDSLQFGNGDGILFYPGHMPFYPNEDRGLNALIPSIRLKNIRRGQQDAALMRLVEKKIGREKVIALVNTVIPKALSEVPMNAPTPWSQRGDDYENARQQLLSFLDAP